ncbi:MAG: DUF899 family protein, partial [Rubrobacteraceae bacterium]
MAGCPQGVLAREKEETRARDALRAERGKLPMVEVEKDYAFEGPGGTVRLLDLFEGRRQLIVQHFMFDPSWDDGCPSCTYAVEDLGDPAHLHDKDTSFAVVSRAPFEKIEGYKQRKGWTFPWYSSFGNDFNYDFHVTSDESVTPVFYNYRTSLHMVAVCQARSDARGGTYYRKKIAEGKSRKEALRCLKRRIS